MLVVGKPVTTHPEADSEKSCVVFLPTREDPGLFSSQNAFTTPTAKVYAEAPQAK
jgi:hypothetical protein